MEIRVEAVTLDIGKALAIRLIGVEGCPEDKAPSVVLAAPPHWDASDYATALNNAFRILQRHVELTAKGL